jgi:hypothetical protein
MFKTHDGILLHPVWKHKGDYTSFLQHLFPGEMGLLMPDFLDEPERLD